VLLTNGRIHTLAAAGSVVDTLVVRDGRVAVFKEDLFGRPGPRLAQGLEQLAALLNPV